MIRTCGALDCNKTFEANTYDLKNIVLTNVVGVHPKEIFTKKRGKNGLCIQCGGLKVILTTSPHKNKVSPNHCKSCQEYFQDRYNRLAVQSNGEDE